MKLRFFSAGKLMSEVRKLEQKLKTAAMPPTTDKIKLQKRIDELEARLGVPTPAPATNTPTPIATRPATAANPVPKIAHIAPGAAKPNTASLLPSPQVSRAQINRIAKLSPG